MSCPWFSELFAWCGQEYSSAATRGATVQAEWNADVFHRGGSFHERFQLYTAYSPFRFLNKPPIKEILPPKLGGRFARQGLPPGTPDGSIWLPTAWSASVTVRADFFPVANVDAPELQVVLRNVFDTRMTPGQTLSLRSTAACNQENILAASNESLFVVLTLTDRFVRESP
jgi:hypothetical protein